MRSIKKVCFLMICFISFVSPVIFAETLKVSHIANTDNIWHQASVKFAELLKKNSNGELEVAVYPNSELGTERETIEGIPLELADFTITGDSLSAWVPEVSVLSQAYAFQNDKQIIAFMESPIFANISEKIRQKTGLRVIAYFLRGPRYVTSNKPIRKLADVKGLKIRVPNVPLFVENWKNWGAQPTPLPFAEVFGALQQGVVDAQENPLALIKSAKFYEVQKFINLTAHIRQPIFFVIGEKKFTSLSKKLQKAVMKSAKEMQDYERKLFYKDEKSLRSFLEKKGVTFVNTDVASFEKASRGILEKIYPDLTKTMESIRKLNEKNM